MVEEILLWVCGYCRTTHMSGGPPTTHVSGATVPTIEFFEMVVMCNLGLNFLDLIYLFGRAVIVDHIIQEAEMF